MIALVFSYEVRDAEAFEQAYGADAFGESLSIHEDSHGAKR